MELKHLLQNSVTTDNGVSHFSVATPSGDWLQKKRLPQNPVFDYSEAMELWNIQYRQQQSLGSMKDG